ncbi:WSC-domain-containing protein [Lophiostoma macrostomum CBS 122681]|uniref:WSC-domain-containing protein n=1 Tax=Lophiostoma macrostomum CBS 122681 TaxID=1314788 RepID=A0A6A6SYH3_9PLEO|nr:WSC-domain-containing protein [Lophiostoma macrostomum CBS 122681]
MYATIVLLLPVVAHAARIPIPRRIPDLPRGWDYSGCFLDRAQNRSLRSDFFYNESGMTTESCVHYCQSKGYPVAGTEYSGECYCGSRLPSQTSGDCHMRCSGDLMQVCGGHGALSTYSSLHSTHGPVANPGVLNWEYLGCYADTKERLLLHQEIMGNTTVSSCVGACAHRGFSLAGVEYGNECWCDNGSPDASLPTVSGCETTCNGNRSELCGGTDRLNIYKLKCAVSPLMIEAISFDIPGSLSATAAKDDLQTIATSATPVLSSSSLVAFISYGNLLSIPLPLTNTGKLSLPTNNITPEDSPLSNLATPSPNSTLIAETSASTIHLPLPNIHTAWWNSTFHHNMSRSIISATLQTLYDPTILFTASRHQPTNTRAPDIPRLNISSSSFSFSFEPTSTPSPLSEIRIVNNTTPRTPSTPMSSLSKSSASPTTTDPLSFTPIETAIMTAPWINRPSPSRSLPSASSASDSTIYIIMKPTRTTTLMDYKTYSV